MNTSNILSNDKLGYISENGLGRFLKFFKEMEQETYPEILTKANAQITKMMFDYLYNKYSLPEEAEVLDIGCGQGEAMQLFKNKGFLINGITLNATDLKVCGEKNLDVSQMDQSFLDFPDDQFDLLWARHVLEHSIFPYYTLWEYNRILKNSGLIYIEVPAPQTVCQHENNQNHYNVLTKSMWLSLISRTGFELLEYLEIPLKGPLGDDAYYVFICKKTENRESKLNYLREEKGKFQLFMALSSGENFGWGVCSKYLNTEVSKLYPKTIILDYNSSRNIDCDVHGKVFHALTGIEFESLSKIRGTENYGYTFFENELTSESKRNAENYDLIFAGSTWCVEKMKSAGINHVDVLIQGIDPEYFYPISEETRSNLFVIFSGGKFELRKGQDLVLKAVKIMQKKYPDIILLNAWYNMWPKSMEMMRRSKHIKFEIKSENWLEFLNHLYEINGLDKQRIISSEIISNTAMRDIFKKTDIGLFPNRCEGGTNLVLMEYMACGKPVIASNSSGHKDILTEQNSLMLKDQNTYQIFDNNGTLWADWEESSIDEIVASLEYAYHNREKIKEIGRNAGEHMKSFTWQECARSLLSKIR